MLEFFMEFYELGSFFVIFLAQATNYLVDKPANGGVTLLTITFGVLSYKC